MSGSRDQDTSNLARTGQGPCWRYGEKLKNVKKPLGIILGILSICIAIVVIIYVGHRSKILQLQAENQKLTEKFLNHKVGTQKIETTNHVLKTTKLVKTTSATTPCQDCAEHFYRGNTKDGVYTIYPGGQPVDVYCDMSSQGSIVLQKRFDGSVNFTKTFEEYSNGFGDLKAEHWLGLNHVYRITKTGNWTLRIDLESFDKKTRYAKYNQFRIGPAPGFQLLFDKSSYSGNAGTSGRAGYDLSFQHGSKFSTYDRDQDGWMDDSCGTRYYNGGGWWYNGVKYCAVVITTGMPYNSAERSIIWYPWKRVKSLKSVTLKMRKVHD